MQTAAEMKAHVMTKAAEDDEFRSRLIENPNAAISSEIGGRYPRGLQHRGARGQRRPRPTWCCPHRRS